MPTRTIDMQTKDARDLSTFTPLFRVRKNKDGYKRYRALLEAVPDAIVIVDQSSTIVLVNAQAETLFGYDQGELIGRPGEILISEHFRSQHSEQYSRFLVASSGRPTVLGLDLFGLRKDGSEFPAEIRLSPLDTNQGLLVSGAIRDLSSRRRTEEDLRRLASIVACSDDAIIGKTLEGIITSWNQGAERMYGYSAKEAIGQSSSMLVPIDRPNEIHDVLERLKRGEILDHFETLRVRKDGEQFHIEITASPIRDAMERVVGASTIGRDISERKRREEDQSRLAAVVESSHDAIIGRTLDGIITHWNNGAQRIYGYSAAEIVGKSTSILLLPDRFAEMTETMEKIARGEVVEEQDAVRLRRDGKQVHFALTHAPIKNGQGQVVGVSTVGKDITDRKRSEDDRSRIVAIVESSYDAIISLTPQGIILTWNHGAERTFGYLAEEMLGNSILSLCLPDQTIESSRLLQRVERAETVELFETVSLKKDGTHVQIALSLAPIKRSNGEVVGISGIFRDITEIKRMEQMFFQSQKMEAVGQLAGGVAHDFNNLLGVIIGYTELLLQDLNLKDRQRREIEEIQKAGVRATLLTRQLLAFSRKQVLQPKVLDLNSVVSGAEELLRRLIGENIEILLSLKASVGRVKADPGQIEQIIMNLAVNARDAMPDGGKLTIETSNIELDETYAAQHPSTRPGPHAMIAVTDNGCGMDAITQAHMFEPFFTTKEFGKGTGLGLATVYGIVKQSGGSVWAYSELGVGTTFKIYLPCVDQVIEVESVISTVERMDRSCWTILVVEDDAALLEVTNRSLEKLGYVIFAAQSPAEAIHICESHPGPIHLMVTDVIMPGISGVQLASQLSTLRPEMRVLYVSGYTDTILHEGVLQPGLAFLQKPFSPKTLARKVNDLLTNHKSYRIE
jgi:two-component system cell cycle sensor histidine kinase/response regulator CckA